MSWNRLIDRWNKLTKQPDIQAYDCKVCNAHFDLTSTNKFETTDKFQAGTLIRYECPQCKVIFGDLRFLMLSPSEIADDYMDLYSTISEADTTSFILDIVNTVGLKQSEKILDYACGAWNKHIQVLQSQGYDIIGYDPFVGSQRMLPPKEDSYDIVMCNNYIEHVIDPIEDLRKMVKLIKPGGRWIVSTSCFEYAFEFTHYHTYFFVSEESIRQLEDKLGIKCIHTQKVTWPHVNEFSIVKVFEKL